MSDYIRRDDALNIDFRCKVGMFESRLKTAERTVQAYADAIADLPSADVVEVVRCKDCKRSYSCPGGLVCSYGLLVDTIVEEDFFCADGKRRSEWTTIPMGKSHAVSAGRRK